VQNLRGIHIDFGAGRATTGPFCIASKTSQKNPKEDKEEKTPCYFFNTSYFFGFEDFIS
jgi:hypothetical protein